MLIIGTRMEFVTRQLLPAVLFINRSSDAGISSNILSQLVLTWGPIGTWRRKRVSVGSERSCLRKHRGQICQRIRARQMWLREVLYTDRPSGEQPGVLRHRTPGWPRLEGATQDDQHLSHYSSKTPSIACIFSQFNSKFKVTQELLN